MAGNTKTGGKAIPDYSGKKGFDLEKLYADRKIYEYFKTDDGEDTWDYSMAVKKSGINTGYLDKVHDGVAVKNSGRDFDKLVKLLGVDSTELSAFLKFRAAVDNGEVECPKIEKVHKEMIPDYINGWKGAFLAEIRGEIPEEEDEPEDEVEDEDEDL